MYKEYSGTVLGIIKFAIPIGGSLIPFAFSMLSKYASFKGALSLFPVVAAAGFITLALSWKLFQPFIHDSSSIEGTHGHE